MKNTSTPFIIENKIFLIRGFKVMLDSDLAELYGITTYNLNKAVKRNMSRFPADFMFQLSKEEFKNLIFQFGISKNINYFFPVFACCAFLTCHFSHVTSSGEPMQIDE